MKKKTWRNQDLWRRIRTIFRLCYIYSVISIYLIYNPYIIKVSISKLGHVFRQPNLKCTFSKGPCRDGEMVPIAPMQENVIILYIMNSAYCLSHSCNDNKQSNWLRNILSQYGSHVTDKDSNPQIRSDISHKENSAFPHQSKWKHTPSKA